MLLQRFDDDLRLERVVTPEESRRWREAFVRIYPEIFSGEPYNESISDEEAAATWDFLTRAKEHITILALTNDDQLAGFGIAIPVAATRLVAAKLAGLVPHKHTYYLAELGILPMWRGRGLGRALVHERIKRMDTKRYSHVVLRVSGERNPSYDLYTSMGFEDMGVYMEVKARRLDGHTRVDKRLFLSRVLSQVDVE